MSRYKLRFVPQGAFPQDLNMGIHMQREVVPGEPGATAGCVPTCTSWAVAINDVPSTGDVHHFLDAATTMVVTLLGGELCGGCLEWEIRKLSAETADEVLADFSVTPNGCDGATVEGAGMLSYAGLWFGLYPTLDGHPFCEPILFRMYEDCVETVIDPNTQFGTVFRLDGLQYCDGISGPECELGIDFGGSTICPGADITWVITQTAGTAGNGETLVFDFEWSWHLEFTTLSDLTDAAFDCVPTVHRVTHLRQHLKVTAMSLGTILLIP
jgi:hypothetical protein